MNKKMQFQFRLYIARDTPNSSQAILNLNAICKEYLAGSYELEIVDVFAESNRAFEDHIMMTPTLIRIMPLPLVKIVGTLADTKLIVQKLGLGAEPA